MYVLQYPLSDPNPEDDRITIMRCPYVSFSTGCYSHLHIQELYSRKKNTKAIVKASKDFYMV